MFNTFWGLLTWKLPYKSQRVEVFMHALWVCLPRQKAWLVKGSWMRWWVISLAYLRTGKAWRESILTIQFQKIRSSGKTHWAVPYTAPWIDFKHGFYVSTFLFWKEKSWISWVRYGNKSRWWDWNSQRFMAILDLDFGPFPLPEEFCLLTVANSSDPQKFVSYGWWNFNQFDSCSSHTWNCSFFQPALFPWIQTSRGSFFGWWCSPLPKMISIIWNQVLFFPCCFHTSHKKWFVYPCGVDELPQRICTRYFAWSATWWGFVVIGRPMCRCST